MAPFSFFRAFHGRAGDSAFFTALPLGFARSRGLSSSKLVNNGDDHPVLPVMIVGAGPVGLVLSILLTRLGVRCGVLEKAESFSRHPQAHFINNRTMEVFRNLDGLAEEIQRSQPPVELWRKFVYCTSLSGSVLGSVDHMKIEDFEQIVSPTSVAHFSQYKLTRLLLKQLEHLNFRVCPPEGSRDFHHMNLEKQILMGHECVAIDTSNDYITVTTSSKDGKEYKERNVRCNIVIGADGSASTVRKLVGIDMKGERGLQKLVSVHFLSKDLGLYLLNERPGMLFFIFNTEAIGVLVAHNLEEGEFVLQIPYYPPQQNVHDFDSKRCGELIYKLVGRELEDIAVLDIKPWVMHAEVAEKLVCRDNRIILAGDAAHRFPPAGGFGMNTGIQDSHNLAWKIASVVKGIAPFSLLKTYETERRPIAVSNTELSIQNFKAAMAVPAALGLDPTVANSVHRVINDVTGAFLPSGLQKAVLEGIFAVGRAQLSEVILNDKNLLGSSRLAKLREIFDEGKSLQLQFPAEDLGFRYLEGALIPDSANAKGASEAPTGRRREYIPAADPGCRLPHMKVGTFSETSSKVISTLDLISGDKLEFLLIIAPIESSYNLARAALEVAEEFKVPVKICVLWSADKTEGIEAGSKTSLAPCENFMDVFEVKKLQNSLSWWNICKMTDEGAIFVRPDGHVAWRVKSRVCRNPVSEMRRVFSAVLCVPNQ